ncbi:hypothetical protein C0995_015467 [Termitomyces sp. Mi166|nr:hypothetical protein C0995_015467 [Termitomyces sp. Mi166\
MAKPPLPVEVRRVRTLLISLPIMVATGYVLYNRLVLDEPQRKLPPRPSEEASVRGSGCNCQVHAGGGGLYSDDASSEMRDAGGAEGAVAPAPKPAKLLQKGPSTIRLRDVIDVAIAVKPGPFKFECPPSSHFLSFPILKMPDLLHTSVPASFPATSFGGRNYDYTKIYSPDKPGDEAKGNARVWNVYLDEAENYDADMIQGFRTIIDGLLVFASLFSAVVTTFVAQTSQALQPDNAQIIVSLLYENNQLLRATGNKTGIPPASLGPGSRTYTSIDVWVNGLFFTSLALSLSTALLTVLAKQWIQAYTAIVPGGAKTRAIIRHFRFQGLKKWRLGDIIESLPLILHGSVAIFLVGLALYVSQLSSPICAVVSIITTLAFLFYLGTSLLPAFDIACPYRITFMFSLAQPLVFALCTARYALLHLWYRLTGVQRFTNWPKMSRMSLKMAEHSGVFVNSDRLVGVAGRLACDSLNWVFNHSSNHSLKEVVIEGACGLLDEWPSKIFILSPFGDSISNSEHNHLFISMVVYCISQLPDVSSTSMTEDEVDRSTCGKLIGKLMKFFSSESLLDGHITYLKKDWEEQIENALINAYETAVSRRYRALSRRLLDWGHPNMLQSGRVSQVLFLCAKQGDGEDIRDLLDRGMEVNHRDPNGWTPLHHTAFYGNLNGVIALVEREPNLISIQAKHPFSSEKTCTALDIAVEFGNPDVVAYLLDHGADPPNNSATLSGLYKYDSERTIRLVEVLLDRGWDRTAQDGDGRSPADIARSRGQNAIAEHLERYQTVRLPYPTYSESKQRGNIVMSTGVFVIRQILAR